jgi:sucrose-6-phosphate hydrolase SacC (GH32 family)
MFHFAPTKNWMNDPNGLVYYHGEYHLYFQHNPYSTRWGNITWGHAVSTDLLHWKQLEHAIYPFERDGKKWDAFSGSAIVDITNSSGLCLNGSDPPLVVFYTAQVNPPYGKTSSEQRSAVSYDKGRTFTTLPDPVISSFSQEPDHRGEPFNFARDPKVFWHEQSRQWILVLWLRWESDAGGSSESVYGLFSSHDLRSWTLNQRITMVGDYECPDLFELPVSGATHGQRRYVFWSGAGTYLIGTFDGKQFTPSSAPQHAEFGDGYAAQTYFGEPNGRRVQMSWLGHDMSRTCKRKMAFSETDFMGQMSIPMELDLVSLPSGLSLRRRPVKELSALRRDRVQILPPGKTHTLTSNQPLVAQVSDPGAGLEFLLQVQAPSDSNVKLQVQLLGRDILLDIGSQVFLSNFTVGTSNIHTELLSARAVLQTGSSRNLPVQADEMGDITIHVIVDRLSLEFFDITGGASMTLCAVARHNKDGRRYQDVRIATVGGPVNIKEINAYELHV